MSSTEAAPAGVAAASRPRARPWVPRQHGAWAMLALPIMVGIATSRPVPAQVLLAVAAVAGYLLSAAAQAWLRARRRGELVVPLIAAGGATVAAGGGLVALEPRLLLAALVMVPAGAMVLAGARAGTARGLATSLAQVAQAAVLAPAAMLLAGEQRAWPLAAAALVVAAEMAGSVLVVRSCIRERGNLRFAAASLAAHGALTAVAAVTLPVLYAALGLALTLRAAALPLVRARRAAAGRPLRPIQVGMVEAAASLALVLAAFAAPLTPH
jgi:hypothetical protein